MLATPVRIVCPQSSEIPHFQSTTHSPYHREWGARTNNTNSAIFHTWSLPKTCFPLSNEISRPRHNGRDKSSFTLSRKKFPLSILLNSLRRATSPTTLHIFKAASMVIYHGEMPWSWTQKLALSNFTSLTGVSLSYCCMTTKCLSKLQGSLERILSTSF